MDALKFFFGKIDLNLNHYDNLLVLCLVGPFLLLQAALELQQAPKLFETHRLYPSTR
jgi:hypothetical protein